MKYITSQNTSYIYLRLFTIEKDTHEYEERERTTKTLTETHKNNKIRVRMKVYIRRKKSNNKFLQAHKIKK